MNRTRIGAKEIGDGSPCFIIAEAGSNHDGKLSRAKELTDAASKAGADAIKFQTFRANRLFNEVKNKETVDTLARLELRGDWYKVLMAYANRKGIEFLASAFDEESADFLEELGVPAFKIASYELVHIPLIKHIARKKKPVILSTGMANEREIRDAVEAVYATGNKQVVLLHCVSQYPAATKDLNLRSMLTLKKRFACPVGFSDHTTTISAPVAAAAIGANMIEKHLTTSRKLVGPDHSYALEPTEFEAMVAGIREVEAMLGAGELVPTKAELGERDWRRAIYAARNIRKGTKLKREMLMIVRPSPKGAIPPKDIDRIVGRATKQDLRKGDLLTKGAVDL
jgi:N-acetylneuraminate synthase/N,N'-diacetyllegionaminate synthase